MKSILNKAGALLVVVTLLSTETFAVNLFAKLKLDNGMQCSFFYKISGDAKNIIFLSEEQSRVNFDDAEKNRGVFDPENFGLEMSLKFLMPHREVSQYKIDSIDLKRNQASFPSLSIGFFNEKKQIEKILVDLKSYSFFSSEQKNCVRGKEVKKVLQHEESFVSKHLSKP